MKRALVTGVAGQDGLYLSRRLRSEGRAVTGIVTPGGNGSDRVSIYSPAVDVVPLDLRDADALRALIDRVEPDEVYNLAAVSSVGRSWAEPELTYAVNATAVEVLVDTVVALQGRLGREIRLFQASSAEIGAGAADSPYARAKAAAEESVRTAREERNLFGCMARLYIHESPLRAPTFVSRKITQTVAEIATGRASELTMANIDVVRDWGFAGDYVDAVCRLMALDEPVELPIGTGMRRTLGDMLMVAFDAAGLGNPDAYVRIDPSLSRPADTPVLVADPEPARSRLGWRATVTFEELIEHMVTVDLERLRSGVADHAGYLYPGGEIRP